MKRIRLFLTLLLTTAILLVTPIAVNASIALSFGSYQTSVISPSTAQVPVTYSSDVPVFINLKLIDSNGDIVGTEKYYDSQGRVGCYIQSRGYSTPIIIPYSIPSGTNMTGCKWRVQMFDVGWGGHGSGFYSTANVNVSTTVGGTSIAWSIEPPSTVSPNTTYNDIKVNYANNSGENLYLQVRLNNYMGGNLGSDGYVVNNGTANTNASFSVPVASSASGDVTWKCQLMEMSGWTDEVTSLIKPATAGSTPPVGGTSISWTVEPPSSVSANQNINTIKVNYANNSGKNLYLQVRLNNSSFTTNLGSDGYVVNNGTANTNASFNINVASSASGSAVWKCQLMEMSGWSDEVSALTKNATVGGTPPSTGGEIQIGFYTNSAYDGWWSPSFGPMDDMAWMGADYYVAYENRSQMANQSGQPSHRAVEHTVLQGANARGLKAHYCMKSLWENTLVSESVWKNVINEYKNEPGLGAWYIADEPEKMDPSSGYQDPNWSVVNIIQERQTWTKEADSEHNTSYCEYDYVKGVDLISTIVDDVIYDHYPVDNRRMDGNSIRTDEMRKIGAGVEAYRNATNDSKNIISAPQLFAFDQYEVGTYYYAEGGRYPTMAEVKAMTYEAIIHGAKGICFYHWRDFSEWSTYGTDKSAIKDIITELKTLSDVIMSGTRVSTGLSFPVAYSDIPEVDYQRWTYDGDDYLIVCNLASSGKTSDIYMSGIPSSVEVMFQNRNKTTSNSRISEYMSAYKVNVYKW